MQKIFDYSQYLLHHTNYPSTNPSIQCVLSIQQNNTVPFMKKLVYVTVIRHPENHDILYY